MLALAAEGWLLLRPEGFLVHAARQNGRDGRDDAAEWWRGSPVHMGCSIPSCSRPARRTATYRQQTARGAVWRAYGFCDRHDPPPGIDELVYRLGRPPAFDYDVPLTPVWAEIYFLLGLVGFGAWCICMWRTAAAGSVRNWIALSLAHVVILVSLWNY